MATKQKQDAKVEETTEQEPSKAQILGRVRNEAVRQVIEENQERFKQLMTEGAEAAGVEWKPRPTAEERAKQQEAAKQAKAQEELQKLLSKYPGLAETFAPVAAENQVDQDDDAVHATV